MIAAPVGAEVVIKNVSHSDRRLHALDGGKDTKLLDGVINPGGPKSFRVPDAGKVLTSATTKRRTCAARSSS